METKHQISRTWHQDRRPPSAAIGHRRAVSARRAARSTSPIDTELTPRGGAEQRGLTLTAPPRYRSLLVPVDGTPFGEHALPLALGIARRAGAEVRVVHVHLPLESTFQHKRPHFESGLDALLRHRQQAYLDDLIRRLRKVTTVPVRPLLLEGREIATSLLATASAGTDLVVMSTHGRGPLARLWRGSIVDELMRRLSVPLLLVRGSNVPVDLTADPLVRHILVPLDGSKLAEHVLEPAAALGSLTSADHTLLHVARPVIDDSVGDGRGSLRDSGDRRQAKEWRYLRRVAARLGRGVLPVHPRIVQDERPIARAILRYAQAHDVDLIALATRGHGWLSKLFRGSVADRVARGASVPVLVLRSHGEPDEEEECRDEHVAGRQASPTCCCTT